MGSFVVKRVIATIPVLLVVGLVVFTILHLIPGDPAAIILGPEATIDQIEALRSQLGLDRPWIEQLVRWLGQLVRGDLGQSLYLREPVSRSLASRLEPTLLVMGLSILFAVIFGVSTGTIAALHRTKIVDRLMMGIALVGVSTPAFWLGLNLILWFSLRKHWFPATGYVSLVEGGVKQTFRYLVLPAMSLGLQQAAVIARITRSSVLDALLADYVRTGRAKGLGNFVLIGKHVLKNAALPILTIVGTAVAQLAGGAVVTETVFNLPGVGRLLVASITRRDYPVVQAVVLLSATLYVIVNLIVDLLYAFFDPRVKFQ